jgi:hypothetical protein
MKLNRLTPFLVCLASILLLTVSALRAPAQSVSQTIILSPGANSVFLEVTPTDTNVADVFSNPEITSVWTPKIRSSTVAFIQNPNSIPFNTAGWMVYIPTNQPQSINNDLYTVTANTAYVVNVAGSSNIVMTVSGRPSLQPQPFSPNAYTLRGFPVDSGSPPTFKSFFQWSAAHFGSTGTLTPIYRYNSLSKQWQQVNSTDQMTRGPAYWVFTTGASSYMAPLTATCPTGDGLDFGTVTFEEDLTLRNLTVSPMTVTVNDLGSGPSPIVYETITNQATQAQGWVPLPQGLRITIPASGTTKLPLAVQRSQMTGASFATTLSLSDGNGTLLHVPVSALAPDTMQAGLWVGDITVNAVASTYINPTNPTPTAQPFVMRAMLHVTPSGATRFLREAIEMLQPSTFTTNGSIVTTNPPQTVLLTDTSLLPQYTGVITRDGVPVGRRISTAAFDFDPPGGTNFLPMNGTFAIGNTVGVNLTLTPTTPTNPFLHRYNPDHDNLDPFYQPLSTNVPPEVYTVTRQIAFTFTPTDPSSPGGQPPTDYGVNEIGGTYNETLIGLHANPLVVSGTFHLNHVLTEPYLNVVQ